MIDKNIINANIKLQDINKILEKENKEYKELLLACNKVLSKYEDDEKVYYLLQDIKEVIGCDKKDSFRRSYCNSKFN